MSTVETAKRWIANTAAEAVYDNPVVTREFRTRMRGWKAFTGMGLYVLVLTAVMLIAFYGFWQLSYTRQGLNLANAKIGRDLFSALTWTQTILLMLFLPSLTAGSLTQEIERKTMEMLALTRLSAGKVVVGKQLSGFLYAVMLLGSSLPLAGMCLILGGTSPGEITMIYALLVAWSFLITCGGVMWSSLYNRTSAASMTAFGGSFLYLIGTSALAGWLTFAAGYRSSGNMHPFGYLNPGIAVNDALAAATFFGHSIPAGLFAIIFHLALGALFLLVASTHVRYHRVERALPIRLLVLAITAYLFFFSIHGGVPSPNTVTTITVIVIVAGIFLAAIFATGPILTKPGSPVPLCGLSGRRLFRSDIGGSILFVGLWAALALMAAALAMVSAGSSPFPFTLKAFWKPYCQLGLSTVVICMAFAAFGVMASSMVKQRRNAAGLVVLAAVIAFGAYGALLANYQVGTIAPDHPVWHMAMLWPLTAMFSTNRIWNGSFPHLGWIHYAWLWCSVAYAILAVGCLAIATPFLRRTGGVQEDMY